MRSSPEVQAVEQLTEGLEEGVGYRAGGFAIVVSQGRGAFPGGVMGYHSEMCRSLPKRLRPVGWG